MKHSARLAVILTCISFSAAAQMVEPAGSETLQPDLRLQDFPEGSELRPDQSSPDSDDLGEPLNSERGTEIRLQLSDPDSYNIYVRPAGDNEIMSYSSDEIRERILHSIQASLDAICSLRVTPTEITARASAFGVVEFEATWASAEVCK